MTPPKILICNYTPAEEKAWRFLLRGFPMLEVVSVPQQQFGCTMAELAEGKPKSGSAEPNKVTKEHAFRAILTDSNRNWTLNRLYAQLEQEERSLMGKRK